jgi:hypothetical protein
MLKILMRKMLARLLAFSNTGLFEGANVRIPLSENQTSFVFPDFLHPEFPKNFAANQNHPLNESPSVLHFPARFYPVA